MKLLMSELEILCNTTFSKVEQSGLKVVNLSENFYWEIDIFDAFEYAKKPNAGMGSLFDDWDFVGKVTSSKLPMFYYDFHMISNFSAACSVALAMKLSSYQQ